MQQDFDNYFWRDNEDANIDGVNETVKFVHSGVHLKFATKPQKSIDLHGMCLDDAAELIHQELLECHQTNIRHLKIIHGKGENARLKSAVYGWLKKHPLILGFCIGPNPDGGSGCVYVLIRRFK